MIKQKLQQLISQPAPYTFTRSIFIRLMGLVFLVAHLSLWVQIDALIGSEGILPIKHYLESIAQQLEGSDRF